MLPPLSAPETQSLPDCSVELDPATEMLDGAVLVGGTPLRLLKLSPAGQVAFAELLAGQPATTAPRAALARRLVDAGLAHPKWHKRHFDLSDVTVVVPVRDRTALLDSLLADLSTLRCLVVDDASHSPSDVEDVARRHGAQLVRSESPLGPGGARNLGARQVATPLVCFVDSDIRLVPGIIEGLLDQLNDPRVAAVAPRIRGSAGPTLRERFERDASPLDMGEAPALVRPSNSVSYVPSAVLLVRQELAVGLFDEELAVGEDVDAVWRLHEAGWNVRYVPEVTAEHPARPTWRAWFTQRHAYGRSASELEARHGDAAAPLRGSVWALSGWALAVAGRPLSGVVLVLGGVPELRDRLDGILEEPDTSALTLTTRQVVFAAPLVARQLVRSYGPLLVVAGLASRRARRGVLATLVLAGLGRWRSSHSSLDPIRFAALSTADDLAYASGLWRGALADRRLGALRPRVVRRSAASRGA